VFHKDGELLTSSAVVSILWRSLLHGGSHKNVRKISDRSGIYHIIILALQTYDEACNMF
jgi:hypothetical protein